MTEDKKTNIEKILEERARLDSILHESFSKRVAIMFTDIKGSTSFYEVHGDIDGRVMVHRHNEIVLPLISSNKGELMKTIGDATMSAYDDPADAARAAVAIQKGLRAYNNGKSAREQILVRIGINYGMGIVEESDVYGDVVNLASRVESIADAEEIMVSEDMYRAVRSDDEFIFRYVDAVNVKGKSDAVKAYRLIWRDEDLQLGKTRRVAEVTTRKEGVFVLEASRGGDQLKISGFERADGEERAVKNYQERAYRDTAIREHIREITDLLNRANSRGKIGNDLLVRLKETGGLLFDELIPAEIKKRLFETHERHLVISIDETLVQIPWELLYDGTDFLCRRFSVGRSVSTKQPVSGVARSVNRPLKIQVLADPRGDLRAAYDEGVAIKARMEKLDDWVNVSLRTTDIRSDYVRSKIRNFDIVHYAGHAEHSIERPEESGWLLKDGRLTADQIMSMTSRIPMPSLIFSNACQSGQTGQWKLDENYEHRIFGLANAFLLTGVQHYIGTFWEIPDEAGAHFAVNFYENLVDGVAIGESLRQARQSLIEKYGEDTIVWASYMLYGDPTSRYIDLSQEALRSDSDQNSQTDSFVTIESSSSEKVTTVGRQKNKTGLVLTAAAVLLLAVLGGFFALRRAPGEPVTAGEQNQSKVQLPVQDEQSQKRINDLVSVLAADYRAGKFERPVKDVARSGLPTMVIMELKPSSHATGNADRELVVTMLTQYLQAGGTVQMVERELLEKLLTELKLGSSALADPATSLKLGKLLSAQIIITGSIMADDKGQAIMLRLVDTETTAVKKVVSVEIKGKTIERDAIKDLSGQISAWAKGKY